jgi:membrane-associated phospholipid phosphatase
MPKSARFLAKPGQLLAAAAACALAFCALLAIAYGSEPAARIDAAALNDFGRGLREPFFSRVAEHISKLADPAPFLLVSLLLVALATVFRGVREAGAVAALLIGANVSTQLLKPALATPRGTVGGWGIGPEAFPSGHSTAAMSLALAAVLVSPRRFRPFVALAGATFAIAVGFALVAIDAHFPSDVAGGYLMAAGWCFAVQAALAAAERRRPRSRRVEQPSSNRVAILLLAGVAVAAGVGASRLPELVDYGRGHTAFAVVAAATAALASALVAATAASASAARRA